MLQITIPETEFLKEPEMAFITVPKTTLIMEHSLISLSKWESRWHKPFLSEEEKTREELIDYIKCMTINKVDDLVFSFMPDDAFKQINDYINDSMTATVIKTKSKKKHSSEYVTSELIYYWMIALNIPFECAKWHINRLLTLIEVCDIKSRPDKKMSQREIMDKYAAQNAIRKKRLHTKG